MQRYVVETNFADPYPPNINPIHLQKTMKAETERLANELAEAKQQHQVTQDKLTAAEELANHQSVPSTANPHPPPFSIRLNS